MKRLKLACLTFFLLTAPLSGALDDSFGSIEPIDPQEINKQHPFEIKANYDYIGFAKFEKTPFKEDSNRFAIGTVVGDYMFYNNQRCREGAIIEGGYSRADLVWKDNPFFTQQDFNSFNMSLGFFSQRFYDWLWQMKAGFSYQFEQGDFFEYTTYDILFWGRYARSQCLGVHLGFFAETGLKIDRVYPVVGFDWAINQKWKLNAIFPLNMGIVYTINPYWTASLAGRIFSFRQRLAKDEPIPEGLVSYQNSGIELRLDLDINHRIVANIHGGYTLGGMLKVANRDYGDKIRLPFKKAGYLGAECSVSF